MLWQGQNKCTIFKEHILNPLSANVENTENDTAVASNGCNKS